MMRILRALQYFLEEALNGLWKNRMVNLLAIFTIGISVFVLGAFLLVNENLDSIIREWTNNIRVNVFLGNTLNEEEREALERTIRESPEVENYIYISREEAMKRFLDYFSTLKNVASALDENPLPASFELSIKRDMSSRNHIAELIRRLSAHGGIDDIQYDMRWIERLQNLSDIISMIGYILSGILGLAAVFTISNVIKLTVYSRADEIGIMRLVGATNAFIRGPFIMEGAVQGGLGALLGIGMLTAGYLMFCYYIESSSNFLLQFLTIGFLDTKICLLLIISCMAAGFTVSALAVRKFIRV